MIGILVAGRGQMLMHGWSDGGVVCRLGPWVPPWLKIQGSFMLCTEEGADKLLSAGLCQGVKFEPACIRVANAGVDSLAACQAKAHLLDGRVLNIWRASEVVRREMLALVPRLVRCRIEERVSDGCAAMASVPVDPMDCDIGLVEGVNGEGAEWWGGPRYIANQAFLEFVNSQVPGLFALRADLA